MAVDRVVQIDCKLLCVKCRSVIATVLCPVVIQFMKENGQEDGQCVTYLPICDDCLTVLDAVRPEVEAPNIRIEV